MRVIAAVFKSFGTNVYVDSRTLLDYGFENYTSKTIINKDDYTKTKRVLFRILLNPIINYLKKMIL